MINYNDALYIIFDRVGFLYTDRISKLKMKMEACLNCELDKCCMLVTSPANRFYFSNFYSSSGAVLIFKERSYLILDSRYFAAAKNLASGLDIVCTKDLLGTVTNFVRKENVHSLLLENDFVTLNLANKLKESIKECNCIIDKRDILTPVISKMRSIKSQSELENIKKSQYITKKVFYHALKIIKPGLTEILIATELEFFAKKLGAKYAAFDFIVASGENSAIPHSNVSERKIQKNDVILIDIGVNFGGYMSDMSRTVFLGEISSQQKEVYNLVLRAQELAISSIKSGVKCADIDNIVRSFIDSTKYKGLFLHSTGHGVGLNIHEKPFISSKNDDVLEEGMVVTVEPGIYIQDKFGIRIEDMLLVTKYGCENLTHTPKDSIVL